MIIATSGHVDHGKTSLVKAITDIDTDRLAEEKSRGLTIDLGFAYTHQLGHTLGFVDVPGHIRFINNMLAGVAAIDFGLLVIAADDGPMPQTREHLAILELLGIPDGCVVLSKIDRVAPDRIDKARTEIAALIKGTAFEGKPVFVTSCETGEGIRELVSHLWQTSQNLISKASTTQFRLAIDRCFNVKGSGIVVTGAVFSGQVQAGEELIMQPLGRKVRVRQLHTQNQPADSARAGDRCAVNIVGPVEQAEIKRGYWLTQNDALPHTDRVDLNLSFLGTTEQKVIRHGTPVHVHCAAQHVTGRVNLLEARQLESGQSGLAQVSLYEPINCCFGDRIILRDQAARHTLGGGMVLDPFSPARGRSKPQRIALLEKLKTFDPDQAISAELAQLLSGTPLTQLAASLNREPIVDHQTLVHAGRIFSATMADNLLERLKLLIKALERERSIPQLQVELNADKDLLQWALVQLQAENLITVTGNRVIAAGRTQSLSPAEASFWKKAEPLLAEQLLQPPVLHDLAAKIGLPPTAVEKLFTGLLKHKLVVRPVKNRYFLVQAIADLKGHAMTLADSNADGSFTVIEFRDHTGIGRNLCIQLLEYFDSRGFTRRLDDRRIIQDPDR